MLGVSLVLVWIGATTLSQLLHSYQQQQIQQDIDKRTALFSTTLLDALVSEDTPILETSLSGLVEIHPNLLGAEFCNYQNHPLLRWGENVPECHPDAVVKGLDQNLILTTYREVIFEGERFGAIALRWDLVESFKNLEQQVQQITTMLVFAVLLLALVLFILVHLLVVRPIRKVDDYLQQVEHSEEVEKTSATYNSKELIHLCEGVMALLESMAAERELRDEREQLLATLEDKVIERTRDLKKSNDQLSSIMENMGDALFVVNPQGEILVSNPAAKALFPAYAETLEGVILNALFPPELIPQVDQLLSSTALCCDRLLFSNSDMSKVLLELSFAPLPMEEEDHKLVLIRDITRQHDLEEKEQMIAFQSGVAEISANMMHNIGNILAGLSGKTFQMRNGEKMVLKGSTLLHKLSEQVEELSPEQLKTVLQRTEDMLVGVVEKEWSTPLQQLELQLQDIAEIVRQQEHSSKPHFQLSRFHPHSFFKEVVSLLAPQLQKYSISTEIDVASGLNEAYLPRNQLLPVVTALVQNAIDAIRLQQPQNGQITIRFSTAVRNKQPGLKLLIEDNGIGIESEDTSQLFAAGHSADQDKQGRGLHNSGNFVKSFGGTITLQSYGVGKGAILEIWLPKSS